MPSLNRSRLWFLALLVVIPAAGCSEGDSRALATPTPTASSAATSRPSPQPPRMPALETNHAEPGFCNDNGDQQQLNACALEEWDSANRALNREVATLWRDADEVERRLLVTAETRWLLAAKAFCDWSVDVNRDGSVIGLTRPNCMAAQAIAHRQLLRQPRGVTEGG